MKTNNFLQAYQRLPRLMCRAFKQECIEHFGWTEPTFYNKLNHGNFRPNEEKDFAEMLNSYLIKL